MPPENKHLSGRVDKRQIEELERISKEERSYRSTVLRKVIDLGLGEYNKRKAVEGYRVGKISLGKAAELAGASIGEFFRILEDEGVAIRIDLRGMREALESDFGMKSSKTH